MAGRLPNYRVAALNKRTDAKGRVGAAWSNDDGSISVVIDPFVTLHGGKDMIITLFPDNKPRETPSRPDEV